MRVIPASVSILAGADASGAAPILFHMTPSQSVCVVPLVAGWTEHDECGSTTSRVWPIVLFEAWFLGGEVTYNTVDYGEGSGGQSSPC